MEKKNFRRVQFAISFIITFGYCAISACKTIPNSPADHIYKILGIYVFGLLAVIMLSALVVALVKNIKGKKQAAENILKYIFIPLKNANIGFIYGLNIILLLVNLLVAAIYYSTLYDSLWKLIPAIVLTQAFVLLGLSTGSLLSSLFYICIGKKEKAQYSLNSYIAIFKE